MPSTQITEITSSINGIAARTDSSGGAVTPDWSAEELRMGVELFTAGIANPANSFQVVAGAAATMNIVVGSGTSKVDLAIVSGDIGGQGNYVVRLDETDKTIALDAADPSDPRIDEIYVVVYDNIYDSTSRSLTRLAVRKGDPASSPALPGPDSAWEAFLLLSEVTIPAAAVDILSATLVDKRALATVDVEGHKDVGDDHTQYYNAARHTKALHDALTIDHGVLTGLGDDDHTQYFNAARHTKAVHDALNIDADTLDGINSTGFALVAAGVTNGNSHNHVGGDGGQIDHGGLAGLGDDDHVQYARLSGTRKWTGNQEFNASAAAVYITNTSSVMTLTTQRIVIGNHYYIGVRSSAASAFLARNSDGPVIEIWRSGVHTGSIGTTSGTLTLYEGSAIRTLSILDGGAGSSLFLRDGLTDVGAQEAMLMNRGTGTGVVAVGYNSSWEVDPVTGKTAKIKIVDLLKSPRFPGLSIIDQFRMIDFERVSTKEREWGFHLDTFKELDSNLMYLTTKGDEWGYSPNPNAISALLMVAVQDLRKRMATVEGE